MTIRAKQDGSRSEPSRSGASAAIYQLCKPGRNWQGVLRLLCPKSVRITNGEAAGLSCEGPLTTAAAGCKRCQINDGHCGEEISPLAVHVAIRRL